MFSECFECDRTGSPTKQLNQNTIEMLRLSNDTQACIENHRNDLALPFEDPKVCTVCKVRKHQMSIPEINT